MMERTKFYILLVDDSSVTRTIITKILERLEKFQFEFFEASDGLEAYIILNEIYPDLIITDLNMPGMDGYELIEKIKKNPYQSTIPIILISGDGGNLAHEIIKRFKGVTYLEKPFTAGQINETVLNVLNPSS